MIWRSLSNLIVPQASCSSTCLTKDLSSSKQHCPSSAVPVVSWQTSAKLGQVQSPRHTRAFAQGSTGLLQSAEDEWEGTLEDEDDLWQDYEDEDITCSSEEAWSAATQPKTALSDAAAQGASVQPAAESKPLLALDVEYAHFLKVDDTVTRAFPAEVCIVNELGETVLHSYCHPGVQLVRACTFVGGVPEEFWRDALSLKQVARRVAGAVAGALLVGHGLNKDLRSLGVAHPRAQRRETMGYVKLQSQAGSARKLRELSADLLGRHIQSGRHSAREDAVAAMELYLRHIHNAPEMMDAQQLHDLYLKQYLQHGQSHVA